MGQDGGAVAAADQEQQQTNKTAHLVLDTGALIKGQGYRLAAMAERFWTVPEVIAEVRDPKSRCVHACMAGMMDGICACGLMINRFDRSAAYSLTITYEM